MQWNDWGGLGREDGKSASVRCQHGHARKITYSPSTYAARVAAVEEAFKACPCPGCVKDRAGAGEGK